MSSKQNERTEEQILKKQEDKILILKSSKEKEISNLPDEEFKVMVTKMLTNSAKECMNTLRTSTKIWKI